jgi:hypothetical protein
MAMSVVTPERFAKGMTFDEYVRYAGGPENLAREAFGSYFPTAARSAPRARTTARCCASGMRGRTSATIRRPPSSGSPPSPMAPPRSW